MEVTVDKLGRLVLPKSIRDALGIVAGTKVRLEVASDGILLSPPRAQGKLVRRGKLLTYEHTDAVKVGKQAALDTLERVRQERIDDLIDRSMQEQK